MRAIPTAFASLLFTAGVAHADCTAPAGLDRLVQDWVDKKQSVALPIENKDAALCARDRFVESITEGQGAVIGYKAGLTSKAVQERFGTDAPVTGILLERMLLDDGATVPVAFGARPVWEADLLLVVKDEGINAATTPEEALKHISALRPFIELPDLVLAPEEKLDGLQLLAINVGARLGVTGAEIPLDDSAETVRQLADMRVVARGADGAVLAEGSGAATLGNPLSAVVWLAQDLAASGRSLKAGDFVSVGSFTPLTPPKPGDAITVTYEGLPGDPKVSVKFE